MDIGGGMVSLKKVLAVLICLCSISNGNAAVISQYSEISWYNRQCPGLADPNYVSKWRGALVRFFGESVTTEQACVFNGGLQARAYNTDGSPKDMNMPLGVAFTPLEVGNVDYDTYYGGSQTDDVNVLNKFYGKVTLDQQNLGLPEIKISVNSAVQERNSIGGFAAALYEWQGAAFVLNYAVNFDFFNSGGEWALDGAMPSHDYWFDLTFGVSSDMTFIPQSPFVLDVNTVITSSNMNTESMPLFSADAANPFTGTLSVAFNVNPGDQFWLWGRASARASNGGLLDASHTVTSKLSIDGMSDNEAQQIFATALKQVPNQVPAPETWLLLLLSFVLIISHRKLTRLR